MSEHYDAKLVLGEGDKRREYVILKRMPPTKAVRFVPKVTKIAGHLLLGDGDLGDLQRGTVNLASAAKVILGGMVQIDTDELTDLGMEAIGHECYAGPKKLSDDVHFNDWFTKYPQDMMQVMLWVIWENFKNFFPEGTEELLSLASQIKVKESLSPTDGGQTGSSDESSQQSFAITNP